MLCETVNRLQAARTRKLTKELVVGKSPDLTGKHRSQPPAPEHVGRARFTPQQEVHTPAVRTSTIFILRLNRKYRSACHFEDALQNSKPPSGGSDSQLRKNWLLERATTVTPVPHNAKTNATARRAPARIIAAVQVLA
jgi:hypothetical protein